jgi:DNA-binding GntR family transcriptional regulator
MGGPVAAGDLDGWDVPFYQASLTKAEVAYRRIRQEIVEGLLAPNSLLDQEALAVRLGLSTTPVREALRILESEGLVVNRRHRNTVVAPLDFDFLQETYVVRLSLDPLAVSLAAEEASDEERAAMRTIAAQAESDVEPRAAQRANRRLHRAIYGACHNGVLIHTLDMLWDRCDRYRLMTLHNAQRAHEANDAHRAIVDAVVNRKATTAAALMRDHVSESLDRIRAEARTTDQRDVEADAVRSS